MPEAEALTLDRFPLPDTALGILGVLIVTLSRIRLGIELDPAHSTRDLHRLIDDMQVKAAELMAPAPDSARAA